MMPQIANSVLQKLWLYSVENGYRG